jgi:hypothetical protein
MAGNRFEIQVHALDRFSKTFRDLNNQASKATRPLVNVHRQVGSLAREMHLDKVAKGMGKVSDAAVNVSRTLGLSLGPLEAVFGASGIIGGIAAAGGAAVALGVNFARTGFEVSRASRAMGVSTQDLQQLRGAMKLMGIDASVADETLGSLGHTLQDARFGRDPAALQVLRHLGIGIPMKNGIVDQVAALEGITRALAKISDPQLRRVLADALHIPQEALPALIEGAENLDRLKRKAQDLGVVFSNDGIKKSTEFATSLNLLKVAAEGAADSFGEKLAPSMVTVMDTLTKRLFQSKSSPGSALMGLGLDQYRWLLRFSHVGSLFDKAGDLIRGPQLTTPAQRTVSGKIGVQMQPAAANAGDSEVGPVVKRNNPGNLRSWRGVPSEGGFATFASSMDGLRAMGQQLGLYGDRGVNTLRSVIGRYAPPSENDTGAYLADVAKKTGFDADQTLNMNDRETLMSVMRAMVSHEQGRQPFSNEQYSKAAAQAIEIHVHGLPQGTQVSARSKADNTSVSTRVAYAMSSDMP